MVYYCSDILEILILQFKRFKGAEENANRIKELEGELEMKVNQYESEFYKKIERYFL